MMFEPKTKRVEVDGQWLLIQEISAGVMHDLGDTAEELVVAGIQEPEVKLEQVKRWPASIVLEIAKAVSEFNGFSEGNGSPPNG